MQALTLDPDRSPRPRDRLRIISRDNGVGLSRDMRLMAEVLASNGRPVQIAGFGSNMSRHVHEAGLWLDRGLRGPVHTQIFSERVYRRCLPLARRNLLVPNPEWFLPKWRRHLPRFETVLCKTRHAEAAFQALGCRTHYIGFTSQDRYDPAVPRQRAFFHLAGRSRRKGTAVLLEAWARHPEWPRLTVVQHPVQADVLVRADNIDHRIGYLGDAELRALQNAHLFHVCPSETEGFGHYLMEALSVGAVTLATDGEPMDELVSSERGIPIAPAATVLEGLARTWRVDVAGIEDAVAAALALEPARCMQLGRAARDFFLATDRDFRVRLRDAVHEGGAGHAGEDGMLSLH